MSWIYCHTRNYAVPGIFAIAAAMRELAAKTHNPGNETSIWMNTYRAVTAGPSVLDIPRLPKKLRPSKGYARKELGLIYTALKSSGVTITPAMGRALNGIGIFSQRLELQSTRSDEIHNIVKNSLRTLKRILRKKPGRKLILPGRDVWMWSIMAHKMGVPHIFDPRISRGVSRNTIALMRIVDGWKLTTDDIIFDTGFAGSIYDKIVAVTGIKCHNLMLSTMRRRMGHKEQLYPNHKGARRKALAIEYLPKYQLTGTTKDDAPVQYLADIETFVQAACLTIWFWYHKSPRWIHQGHERCKVVDCSCRSCNLWKEASLAANL